MSLEERVACSDFYVAFDTEFAYSKQTHKNELLEIAAIKVACGEIIGMYQSYVKPCCDDLLGSALEHNKIDLRKLANAPVFEDVRAQFLEFAGSATLVAHNIAADLSVLDLVNGFNNIKVCTQASLKAIGLPSEGERLEDIYQKCLSLGAMPAPWPGPAHNALPDAAMVVSVYEFLKPKIVNKYGEAAIEAHPLVDPIEFAASIAVTNYGSRSFGSHHKVRAIEVDPSAIDESNPYYDRNIVTTDCSAEDNQAISEIAAMLGARYLEKLRKRDNPILIVDNHTYRAFCDDPSGGTGKLKKAKGWSLQVMPVEKFVIEARQYISR